MGFLLLFQASTVRNSLSHLATLVCAVMWVEGTVNGSVPRLCASVKMATGVTDVSTANVTGSTTARQVLHRWRLLPLLTVI